MDPKISYKSKVDYLFYLICKNTSKDELQQTSSFVKKLVWMQSIEDILIDVLEHIQFYNNLNNLNNDTFLRFKIQDIKEKNKEKDQEKNKEKEQDEYYIKLKNIGIIDKDLLKENTDNIKDIYNFIEEMKHIPPKIVYGKIKLYQQINRSSYSQIFHMIKTLPDDFDYCLYRDLPKELIKDLKFLDSDSFNNYKNTNKEIISYQKELLTLGYTDTILNIETDLYKDTVSVLVKKYDNTDKYEDLSSVDTHLFYLSPIHYWINKTTNDFLVKISTKYNNPNISKLLRQDKYNIFDEPVLSTMEKHISISIKRSIENIKECCKNNWDGCYRDMNRKRLNQIAYTNNGCILDVKLNGKSYATVEVVYSKKGLIIMNPYYENKYLVLKDNMSLIDICIKLLSNISINTNIYISPLCSDHIKSTNILTKDKLHKNDLFHLTNKELYYDFYYNDISDHTTGYDIYLVDTKCNAKLDYYISINTEITNMKNHINNLIPKEHIKYKKSVLKYIDSFSKQIIDPQTWMNNKFKKNTIPDEVINILVSNLFEIKKLDMQDKHIIKQIEDMELQEFKNIIFKEIQGYILWSKIYNKVFGYFICSIKQDILKIQSVLVHKAFRKYKLMTMLYENAANYYINELGINKIKMHLPVSNDTDKLVQKFCSIINKVTNKTSKYKILEQIEYDNYINSDRLLDHKYLIYY